MARPGRPRTIPDDADWLQRNLPKKETEEHLQMKSHYLSLPTKERTFGAIAQKFGKSEKMVGLIARAHGWIEAAKARDAEVTDPFLGEFKSQINAVRLKAFRFLCTALDKELARQSLDLKDDEVIARIKQKDIDGALKDWSAKDWSEFTKTLSIRAKDYKDFLHIIDGIRKVVFEWNPNPGPSGGPGGGILIPGNNNKILIHYD